jgi:hypothetical protein
MALGRARAMNKAVGLCPLWTKVQENLIRYLIGE